MALHNELVRIPEYYSLQFEDNSMRLRDPLSVTDGFLLLNLISYLS